MDSWKDSSAAEWAPQSLGGSYWISCLQITVEPGLKDNTFEFYMSSAANKELSPAHWQQFLRDARIFHQDAPAMSQLSATPGPKTLF